MFGIGISLGQRLELEQSIKLRMKHLQLRVQLLEAIHGDVYVPLTRCTLCGASQSMQELLEGFTSRDWDTTSLCTVCKEYYQPRMRSSKEYMATEVHMYCPDQVLYALHDFGDKSPLEIRMANAGLYNSALLHFGSLRTAFAKNDVVYTKEPGMEACARPFLYKLPAGVLAEVCGVSVCTVQRWRHKYRDAREAVRVMAL